MWRGGGVQREVRGEACIRIITMAGHIQQNNVIATVSLCVFVFNSLEQLWRYWRRWGVPNFIV